MKTLSIQALVFLLVAPITHTAYAACNPYIPLSRPDTLYEVVAGTNQAEVRDKVTKLIWQRCVLGQTWDGTTCVGTALSYSWTNALEAARVAAISPAAGATPWRVPNQFELSSLRERACTDPAVNTTWFPEAPASMTWTSSAYAGYSDFAWSVDFSYGYADGFFKMDTVFVRLVRSSP